MLRREDDKIIANKNRGRALSFIAPLNVYSSVKETKQESTFLVFVFLWSHPTRVGRIGEQGDGEGADERSGQAGQTDDGLRNWPAGCFAESGKR